MNDVSIVDDVTKRAAMEEVLQSATFVRASQVRNFLRYICEMELAGRASALHEYLIAVEAMGLPSSYSTDDDSSVRRRAYALRQKLDASMPTSSRTRKCGSRCRRAATCPGSCP